MGFIHTVLKDLQKETRSDLVGSLEKVEQCGTSPQQASPTMFSLIPKKRHKRALHRSSIHYDQMVEGLRELEVKNWQETHWVVRVAKAGFNGGADRIAWETLFEMKRLDCRASELDQ